MKIALSKGSGSPKYLLYDTWLKQVNESVETIDLSSLSVESALGSLEHCSGIVFTGGSDVAPARYGKPDDISRCKVDLQRDELEFALVTKARELNMPILGICRGLQVLNVALGGSLIVDIPADYKTDIEHGSKLGIDMRHAIACEAGSLIKKICGVSTGIVNSAHHQAVDALANFFTVSAKSIDGIIEAFETGEVTGNSFVLAVQWHPERLEFDNPLSLPIARHFIFECDSYENLIRGREYASITPQPELKDQE